ncbi:CoA-binding protein [archaeon]|nr:CoA-binding protein [archaeon]
MVFGLWTLWKNAQGKRLFALNKTTQIIVQGFGKQGQFHTGLMKEYGANIVAAVTKGDTRINGIPVYNSVKQALKKHKAEWSVLFVPAKTLKEAAFEALDAGLNLVIITEGVPVYDSLAIIRKASLKKLVVIGPNCPGIVRVGETKLGIMPNHIFLKEPKPAVQNSEARMQQGAVSIVSRSGTLTYEIANLLSQNNIPLRFVVGIGGDMVMGTEFIPILELFQNDRKTTAIVLIGEIGGNLEQQAAGFIKKNLTKKVVAYIAGKTAPKGKKMGHAGAIILGESGTAENKIKALEAVGVKIAQLPSDIVKILQGN